MNNKAKKIIITTTKTFLVFFLVTMVLAGYMGVSGFIPAVAPQVAHAAFNAQINYQGKLTDTVNIAVPDGMYHMKFWLLTSATAATTTAIWTEDRSTEPGNRVTVTNGLFSLMLGSSTPLTNIDFNQTLYLGVEVGGSGGSPSWDGEMSPRKVLGAVPAAFEADKLDGLSSERFFRNDITNSTSSATTSLSVAQNGAGKIAEFFGIGGSSAFSILSTGNVGVGTTSPFSKLSIQTTPSSGLTSLFAVASSTNATIFNILGNGNVGIGTTSPDALLEIHNKVSVYGTDKSLLTLSQSDVPYGVDTFVTDDSLTSGYGRSGYGGLGWSYASASNYKYVMWTKYGDATTDWGKIVHENSSGFVGIGTTTPNAPLDVDYTLSLLGGYTNGFRPAISSGSIGDEIGLINATDDKIISAYQTGTNKFFFGTNNGLSGVTVDGSTGFTGVATSSPEAQLDVWGDAFIGNPTGGTARAYVGAVNASFGAGNEAGIWVYDSIYGTQQIGVFDNNQNWQYGGTFGDPGIYIKSIEAVANPLGVGIRTIDPASLLSVNGNGSFGASYDTIAAPTDGLIVEGKAGFGTSSPFSRLSVQGPSSAATTSLFAVASSTKATLFNVLGNGNVGIGTTSPYTNLSVAGQSASSYFSTFTTTATSTFAGGFSAASSLYALQNGNVGIGTAAPSRKFHVSGGSALIENAGAVQLTLYDSSNSQIPNITFNQSSQKAFIQGGAGLNSRLDLGTGASTVVVTVLNTSVGISETAPGSKLSVSGNGSYGTSYDTIAAPTDGLIVEGKAGFGTSSPFSRLSVQGPSSAATTSLFAVASSTNATLFNVLGNGNVGIGTSSPSDRLTLNGSANITGDIKLNNTSRIYLYPNDTNHGIGYNYASAQNGPVIFGWDGVALYSTKYSRKAMKFGDTSDSNVYLYNKTYIGTNQTATVPLSMLDVAGGAAIGSSYALTIAAPTDGLIVEGKAGFGTSSPFSRLSVQGPSSAATTSLFAVASSTKATLFNVLGNGNVGIGTTSPWGRLSVLNTGTDNSFVVADDSNDSTPFVIDAGGNVGIGTLTPGYSLDLSGGSIGSTNGAVLIEASSLGSTGIVKIGDVQGTGNGALVTVDDSSTYHYAFDNLEEVGGGEYFACLKTNGSIYYLLWGTTCDSSTRTVKENISSLDGQSSLARLTRLNPVEFNYKPGYYNGKRDIGFIAEEASQVDPRYALYNEIGKEVNINTRAILSDTVKSVQEIAQRISINDAPTTTPSITINSSGNIGIGTEGSVYKLDVKGDASAYGFVVKAERHQVSNVNKLETEDLAVFAEKLKEIDISTFKFKDEAGAPDRLGVLNDDAPREILTAKGDVDAYKLSVFTLGAVKAEQLRLDSIEERLAIVEGHILGGTSGGGLWANPFETLEDFGISFSESVAKFKNILVGQLTVGTSEKPNGITLYDEATGKPYCVKIVKGKLKNFVGECGQDSHEEMPADDGRTDEPVVTSTPSGTDAGSDIKADTPIRDLVDSARKEAMAPVVGDIHSDDTSDDVTDSAPAAPSNDDSATGDSDSSGSSDGGSDSTQP